MTADEVADLLNLRQLLWDRTAPGPDVSAAQVAAWHQALAGEPAAHVTDAVYALARVHDGWPPSIAKIREWRRMLADRADELERASRALEPADEPEVSPERVQAEIRQLRDGLRAHRIDLLDDEAAG